MRPSSEQAADGDETRVDTDPARPADYADASTPGGRTASAPVNPRLGPLEYLRFAWRQLTNMRTALLLLLLLAVAAVPGSMFPQRSSDPNGVVQYFADKPDLAPVLDGFQLFDVYSSVWFSATYLLLFVSLIGCVLPRTAHHWRALRTAPPRTPVRLGRLAGFQRRPSAAEAGPAIDAAEQLLRRRRYRVERYEGRGGELSVSAERGYLRETGNLVFHASLLGVLVSVGIVGGFAYHGQKVIVEGQTFVNVLGTYDSFNPGRWFDESDLQPYRLALDGFHATFEEENLGAYGRPMDYVADVTAHLPGASEPVHESIRVNYPLDLANTQLYLLGNGYAPTVTVHDGDGNVAFSGPVVFLPQDSNLTSVGVIKVADALPEQLGMRGFFYPSAVQLESGALTSIHPELRNPILTLNVYTGDLGLDDGVPKSVYVLDITDLTQVAGGDSGVEAIQLAPGETAELPGGLGSVTFDDVSTTGITDESVLKFVSLDIHHDPSKLPVLIFAVLALAGLLASLFVPRRRMWVKAVPGAEGLALEYAGLARGEDPGLEDAVAELAAAHAEALGEGASEADEAAEAGDAAGSDEG